MKITIAKNEIYDNVAALTAMVGRMTTDTAGVTVSEDNYPMLNVYVTSGVGELEGELARRLKSSNLKALRDEADTVSVELDTDKVRMDAGVLNAIVTNLKLYFSHYVTSSWLAARETTKAIAEAYRASAAGFLKTIASALLLREEFIVSEQDYEDRATNDTQMDGEDAASGIYEDRAHNDTQMDGEDAASGIYEDRAHNDTQMDGEDAASGIYEDRKAETARMDGDSESDIYAERVEDNTRIEEVADEGDGYALREEDGVRIGEGEDEESVEYSEKRRNNVLVMRRSPYDEPFHRATKHRLHKHKH